MPQKCYRLVPTAIAALAISLATSLGCKEAEFSDTFQADGPSDVDMLWIIDNSASMDDAQSQLRDSFTTFAEGLPPGSGTQLAITTTQAWPCTQDISSEACNDVRGTTGRTARDDSDPHYFDPASDEQLDQFIELADVGIHGAGEERALQVALMAVCEAVTLPPMTDFVDGVDDLRWDFPWGCSGSQWSSQDPLYEACHCLPRTVDMEFWHAVEPVTLHGTNEGMLRGNPLHIVLFTDEGDDTATNADLSTICPETTGSDRCSCSHAELIRLLRTVVEDVTISVFGPGQGPAADESERYLCNPQLADVCQMDYHYWSVESTGGSFFPIQTSVDGREETCVMPSLSENLAQLVLAHPDTEWFTLSRTPRLDTMEVTLDSVPVPALSEDSGCSDSALAGGGWAYDPDRGAISLTGDCTPYDGEQISVSYTPDDIEVQ